MIQAAFSQNRNLSHYFTRVRRPRAPRADVPTGRCLLVCLFCNHLLYHVVIFRFCAQLFPQLVVDLVDNAYICIEIASQEAGAHVDRVGMQHVFRAVERLNEGAKTIQSIRQQR